MFFSFPVHIMRLKCGENVEIVWFEYVDLSMVYLGFEGFLTVILHIRILILEDWV